MEIWLALLARSATAGRGWEELCREGRGGAPLPPLEWRRSTAAAVAVGEEHCRGKEGGSGPYSPDPPPLGGEGRRSVGEERQAPPPCAESRCCSRALRAERRRRVREERATARRALPPREGESLGEESAEEGQ